VARTAAPTAAATTAPGPASSTTNQLSDLVVVTDIDGGIETVDNDCTLDWDVAGDKATLQKDQVCTVTVNGFNVTVGWTSSSMHLNGDQVTGTTSGATNNGCSFTQQVTLDRM
jgi:hypothetical protein